MAIPTDLNALKQVISQPKEEDSKEAEQITNLRSSEYSEDQLAKAWEEFKANFEAKSLYHEVLILNEAYKVDEHKITVSIPNEALESTFEKFRGDLLAHLRNSLKNDHISINSQVVELEREKMLYTDREKFEHLKKKYPALKDLQDKLGLDPEF